MKLGHLHLKVRNLQRAEKFYSFLLGLKVTERIGSQYAFLSFNNAHHDLALQSVGEEAQIPVKGGVGLYHSAFEVPDAKTLLEVLTRLEEIGAAITMVDHRISWAIYSEDPDGNGVEVYLDRRASVGGSELWDGISHRLTKEKIIQG